MNQMIPEFENQKLKWFIKLLKCTVMCRILVCNLVQNQSYCFAVTIDQGASSPNYKVA